jgi:hypothetical protein
MAGVEAHGQLHRLPYSVLQRGDVLVEWFLNPDVDPDAHSTAASRVDESWAGPHALAPGLRLADDEPLYTLS